MARSLPAIASTRLLTHFGMPTMRFRVLDFYRFCAAVMVMAYHYFGAFNVLFSGASPYVDFFFMLSGFVIFTGYANRVGSRSEYATYLAARLARIYPLHFVTTTFWLLALGFVAAMALNVRHPIAFRADDVVQTYLLLHAWGTTSALTLNVPSWSISAEWGLYIVFPIFVIVWKRFGETPLIVTALAMVLALEVGGQIGLFGQRHWTELTWDFGVARAVPSFLIGIWLALKVGDYRGSIPAIPVGVALFCLSACLVYCNAPRLLVLGDLALALYFTACGERRGEKSWLASQRLVVLGDASYAIYLLHTITLPLFAFALRPLLHDGWPTLPVIMVMTVAVAIGCHRKFELPVQKWINARWRARGTRTASAARA